MTTRFPLWLVLAAVCIVHSPPVWAAADGFIPGHYVPGSKFKLHVSEYADDVYEISNANGWRPPRKVDAQLVEQIGQMRMALPNWQGLHYLKSGGNAR